MLNAQRPMSSAHFPAPFHPSSIRKREDEHLRIYRLPLRTLQRHQLVEILIQRRRLTRTLPTSSQSHRHALPRTMQIDIMLIPHIPKEPDLLFGHKHRHTKRVHRRISKPLIIKPTGTIQPVEIRFILLTPPEVQGADLEI